MRGLNIEIFITRSIRRYGERGFSHSVEDGNDLTDREYPGGIVTSSSLEFVITLVESTLLNMT